jgi:hypothetical protein
MSLWEEIAADGEQILYEFGRTVTFRSTALSVLVDQNPLEQIVADGGFIYRAGFRLRLLCPPAHPLRTNPPRQGEIFIVFGKEYTVTTVTNRPPSPWIDCQVISTSQ